MRKKHRIVRQEVLLDALRETGGGELGTIADAFDISEGSARRKLDGLVAQGLVRVTPAPAGNAIPGHGKRWYEPVTREHTHAYGSWTALGAPVGAYRRECRCGAFQIHRNATEGVTS